MIPHPYICNGPKYRYESSYTDVWYIERTFEGSSSCLSQIIVVSSSISRESRTIVLIGLRGSTGCPLEL